MVERTNLRRSTRDISWPYSLSCWSLKKQKSTAISSTEAKYIALSGCCDQILWMRSQLTDYGFAFNKIPLYCDKMLLLYATTMSSTQDPSTSMSDITLSKSKWKMVWLSSILLGQNISWQTSSLKHWQERFEFLISRIKMKRMSQETLKSLAEEEEE
ncbi:hypothetical protein Tco_1311164 [Tanacetum coccineum]